MRSLFCACCPVCVALQLHFTQMLQHTDVPGFAGLPTFLLGSSLGGCISLHVALKQVREAADRRTQPAQHINDGDNAGTFCCQLQAHAAATDVQCVLAQLPCVHPSCGHTLVLSVLLFATVQYECVTVVWLPCCFCFCLWHLLLPLASCSLSCTVV